MSDEGLESTVAVMRRLGVTRYRSEGVEIELGPPPDASPRAAMETSAQDLLEALDAEMPSPEDLLAWSTTGPLPSEVKYAPPEDPPKE